MPPLPAREGPAGGRGKPRRSAITLIGSHGQQGGPLIRAVLAGASLIAVLVAFSPGADAAWTPPGPDSDGEDILLAILFEGSSNSFGPYDGGPVILQVAPCLTYGFEGLGESDLPYGLVAENAVCTGPFSSGTTGSFTVDITNNPDFYGLVGRMSDGIDETIERTTIGLSEDGSLSGGGGDGYQEKYLPEVLDGAQIESLVFIAKAIEFSYGDEYFETFFDRAWHVRGHPNTEGEGCSSRYWAAGRNAANWYELEPTDGFATTFTVPYEISLQHALRPGSGQEAALARQATAAMLNFYNPGVDYVYKRHEIIRLVHHAWNTGSFEDVTETFRIQNQLGCPLLP